MPWKSVIVRRSTLRSGWSCGHGAGAGPRSRPGITVAAGVLAFGGGYHPVLGVTASTVHVAASVLVLPILVATCGGAGAPVPPGGSVPSHPAPCRCTGVGFLLRPNAASGCDLWGLLWPPGGDRRGRGRSSGLGYAVEDAGDAAASLDSVPSLSRDSGGSESGLRPRRTPTCPTAADVCVPDCTGGWYAEQERARRMDRLLGTIPDGTLERRRGVRDRLPPTAATDCVSHRLLLATTCRGPAAVRRPRRTSAIRRS